MKEKTVGKIKEAKEFSKEITMIHGYFIELKDEHGQTIYTFKDKKKADEFYKLLIKNHVPTKK